MDDAHIGGDHIHSGRNRLGHGLTQSQAQFPKAQLDCHNLSRWQAGWQLHGELFASGAVGQGKPVTVTTNGRGLPHDHLEFSLVAPRIAGALVACAAFGAGGVDIGDELFDECLDGLGMQTKPAFEMLFELAFGGPCPVTAAAVFVQPDQSAPESPGLDPQLGLSASRRTDIDFDDPEIFHNWRLWVIALDIYTAVLRRTGSQASAALYPRPIGRVLRPG